MKKLEETPARKIRREYEEKHKKQRKEANKVWGTSIDRKVSEDIDAFLQRHNITKVTLIIEGFIALQKQYGELPENNGK